MVVGGVAVNFYGYKRTTGDLDIWVEETIENRRKLIAAFDKLGYGKFEALMTAPFLPGFCEILMDSGIYIDILGYVHGYKPEDFAACFSKSQLQDFRGIPIRFISMDDLKYSKSQSHRAKDQADLEGLE